MRPFTLYLLAALFAMALSLGGCAFHHGGPSHGGHHGGHFGHHAVRGHH